MKKLLTETKELLLFLAVAAGMTAATVGAFMLVVGVLSINFT